MLTKNSNDEHYIVQNKTLKMSESSKTAPSDLRVEFRKMKEIFRNLVPK